MRLVSKIYRYNGLFASCSKPLFQSEHYFFAFFLVSGNRYITITGCWWFEEVAKVLEEEFRPLGKFSLRKRRIHFLRTSDNSDQN